MLFGFVAGGLVMLGAAAARIEAGSAADAAPPPAVALVVDPAGVMLYRLRSSGAVDVNDLTDQKFKGWKPLAD